MSLSYECCLQKELAPIARQLLLLMLRKSSNLALSADVTTQKELLSLAEELGPYICVLKTHIDIIEDFSPTLIIELSALAQKHDFLLFEDRKFADIGHTVKQQYVGGIYRIADWAHLTNAHSFPGPGLIEGLAETGLTKNRGLLLISEMSSQGQASNQAYIERTLSLAKQYANFVMGFITQHRLTEERSFLHFIPGVHFSACQDELFQQYTSPRKAILEQGCDIIIVGRGIIKATDKKNAAKTYQMAGWQAYLDRCQSAPSPI